MVVKQSLPSPSEDSDLASDVRPSTKPVKDSGRAISSAFPLNFDDVENVLDLPESKSRRMLELRLMNNWAEKLARPWPDLVNSHLVTDWGEHVPQMALRYDNVQYMMFACSATYLIRREPEVAEIAASADVYLGLALREQHKAVARLSTKNADSVCFTAMLLLITSVARLWMRQVDPYTPPMEWLHLGTGVGTVLRAARDILMNDSSSKIWMFIGAPPVFDDKIFFARENMKPFCKVLELEVGDVDPETLEAYERTLSYIGDAYQSVDEDEPIYIVARKIISFAIFVPKRFVELVEEKRPCALVILAHYFALMARYPSIWWVGRMPKREIQAILEVLPKTWHQQMRWPMMMAGLAMS